VTANGWEEEIVKNVTDTVKRLNSASCWNKISAARERLVAVVI
jgi:hypothetical protein